MKTTKFIGFLDQNENKSKPSSKFRLWNKKKQKQKHDMCKKKIQQDFIARKK